MSTVDAIEAFLGGWTEFVLGAVPRGATEGTDGRIIGANA